MSCSTTRCPSLRKRSPPSQTDSHVSAVSIRTATTADAAAIAAVHVAGWQAAYDGLLPPEMLASLSVEDRTAQWAHWLTTDRRVLVAVLDGVVVGFVSVGVSRDADAVSEDGELDAIYTRSMVEGSWARLARCWDLGAYCCGAHPRITVGPRGQRTRDPVLRAPRLASGRRDQGRYSRRRRAARAPNATRDHDGRWLAADAVPLIELRENHIDALG